MKLTSPAGFNSGGGGYNVYLCWETLWLHYIIIMKLSSLGSK